MARDPSPPSQNLFGTKRWCSTRTSLDSSNSQLRTYLSTLERIIATHPPILESLLLQLPTPSILHLYHTSRFLRSFLRSYPLAWNHLSFRLFSSGRTETRQASPASDVSGDATPRCSKPYSLDQLLLTVIIPFGTRLRSLDLDHTSVGGLSLTGTVLPARRETLQHLSVRGCKHVSLKYHIVPYLTVFSLQKSVGVQDPSVRSDHLALTSLYTFRCRHHRRRPYLPASLLRRDSDADPTHELIKLCYHLGIWTDSAWCPTPGGRCLRRKDYYTVRGSLDGRGEVWVIFDRLWRSGNRLGRSENIQIHPASFRAQLWEAAENGHEGEPLGCSMLLGQGEGKTVPTHMRQSHRTFVESFTCHDCGDSIPERCEQCSVRMHCTGCRKTLCASCAFARPLPRSKLKRCDEASSSTTTPEREPHELFWWAPGEIRSPNLMKQESSNDDSLVGNEPDSSITPAIKMNWCCLKPMFSGGAGITFVGPGMSGPSASQIRTAPLPKGQGWEDREFVRIRHDEDLPKPYYGAPDAPDYTIGAGHDQILDWLLHGPGSQDNSMCPRSLCQECWQTPGWRAACQACHEPFCFAHDLRGLKMRICGYRDLTIEKRLMEERSSNALKRCSKSSADAEDELLQCIRGLVALTDSLSPTPETTQDLAALTDLPDTNDDDLSTGSEPTAENGLLYNNLLLQLPFSSADAKDQSFPEDISSSFVQKSKSQSPPPTPLPLSRWRGCASFLCPEFRSIGDHRPKCTAIAKECSICGIHVCPECLVAQPACDCSVCKDHYRCPNCFRDLPTGNCKKKEEDLRKLAKAAKAEKKREENTRLERVADEVVEHAGEFFMLVDDIMVEGG